MERQAEATIARSRTLVAAARQHLSRREAAEPPEQGRRRQQAEIDRAAADAARSRALWLGAPTGQIERAHALRDRSVAAIEALAASEDEIARLHDVLAAASPHHRDENLRIAAHACNGARKAREIVRSFTG
jgi:hypothetical protein